MPARGLTESAVSLLLPSSSAAAASPPRQGGAAQELAESNSWTRRLARGSTGSARAVGFAQEVEAPVGGTAASAPVGGRASGAREVHLCHPSSSANRARPSRCRAFPSTRCRRDARA